MDIIIENHTQYHHMPDHAEQPDCYGLTLRRALKTLRRVDFGNMGGTHIIKLSDETWMHVKLTPAEDGNGRLMNSQRCVRFDYESRYGERQIRAYPIV